jgi:hypothetical protein
MLHSPQMLEAATLPFMQDGKLTYGNFVKMLTAGEQ